MLRNEFAVYHAPTTFVTSDMGKEILKLLMEYSSWYYFAFSDFVIASFSAVAEVGATFSSFALKIA